jgi:translation initiation factor IF-3
MVLILSDAVFHHNASKPPICKLLDALKISFHGKQTLDESNR